MAFRAVNSPAVHHTWLLVYRGSSGYTRIVISQGKTNLTQTSKASRFAMFSKSVKNPLPYRFLSLTTLGVINIFLVVFVCRDKDLDFSLFTPFIYILWARTWTGTRRTLIGAIKAFKKGVLYHGENCNRGPKNDPPILEPAFLLVNRWPYMTYLLGCLPLAWSIACQLSTVAL